MLLQFLERELNALVTVALQAELEVQWIYDFP